MAQGKGIKGQLLAGMEETTYGQDPASPAGFVMPFNSAGLRSSQNMITPATITGRRDNVAPSLGNIDVRGSIVVPADAIGMGYWLQMLLGDPVTTGVGPYLHTFKVPASIASWVLEQGFTDITQFLKFNGCKMNSMRMRLGGDEELVAEVEIIGAKETVSGTSVDGTPTTITLERFNNFDAALTEGGSAFAKGAEVEFTITNGLDDSVYLIGGSGFRGSLPEGFAGVTGRLRAIFEDATLLNKAINGTESSLVVTLTSGTNILKFEFNELLYERNSPGVEGPAGIYTDLPFMAYFGDHADDSIVVVELTNDQAAY
jgi:hypothetical protein